MSSGGYIKLFRSITDSEIYSDPVLFKLAVHCLLRANYQEKTVILEGLNNPIRLQPGQFLTGIEALYSEFYKKRRKKNVSQKTLWRKLFLLQKLDFLRIKSTNKYSIISIVNWERYQGNENQMGIKWETNGNQMSTDKKLKKIKKEKNNPSPDFSFLFSRYSANQQKIIHQVFKAIKSTRKSGKVSSSIFERILKSWERFTPEQVANGCQIYVDKGHADQGRGERYLLGIIRGQAKSPGKPASRPIPPPKSEILTCEKIKKMKESRHEPSSTE